MTCPKCGYVALSKMRNGDRKCFNCGLLLITRPTTTAVIADDCANGVHPVNGQTFKRQKPKPDPNCPKCQGTGQKPVLLLHTTVYDPCECLSTNQNDPNYQTGESEDWKQLTRVAKPKPYDCVQAGIVGCGALVYLTTKDPARAARNLSLALKRNNPVAVVCKTHKLAKDCLDEFVRLGHNGHHIIVPDYMMGAAFKEEYLQWYYDQYPLGLVIEYEIALNLYHEPVPQKWKHKMLYPCRMPAIAEAGCPHAPVVIELT